MKFIAKEGAPNIPLELQEAQESDNLILFCGAGISCNAGLPTFKGLVSSVFDDLSPGHKEATENKALDENNLLLDRALHLLEQRINNKKQFRQTIVKYLTINTDADLSTHQAILELSKVKTRPNSHRLVTTNVDQGFLLAGARCEIIDVAPKLPIPKRHKWHSIVHLHGMIDEENNPENESLIFTSGDFGSAYLTEGWASNFVTELFRHFKILFVGYSIDDPILRYIIDSIAAETKAGNNDFQKAWALVDVRGEEKIQEIKATWESKGVAPILFSANNDEFSNLHETLTAWAAHSRDGLHSKTRLIKLACTQQPALPHEQEDNLRVIDTLKERSDPNDSEITGIPAKIFKELSASIEWLPLLDQAGLLSNALSVNKLHFSSTNPQCNINEPTIVTQHLWEWLTSHLESPELITWVLKKEWYLHPSFKLLLKRKLAKEQKPQQDYLLFWQIITSTDFWCESDKDYFAYKLIEENSLDNVLVRNALIELITPVLTMRKSIFIPGQGQRKPYDAKVTIRLEEYFYNKLQQELDYTKQYTSLLIPASTALEKAMQLWELIGYADNQQDRSHWDISSIEIHTQNKRYNRWVILVEMCRDLWIAAYQENPAFAKMILLLWKSFKYPVFRRLILHACANSNVYTAEEALSYLLEDDGYWLLWSEEVQREKFRILEKISKALPRDQVNKLVQVILSASLPDKLKEKVPVKQQERFVDKHVWILLAKLQSFNFVLNDAANKHLHQLSDKHPKWKLQKDGKDEFSCWFEVHNGYQADISEGDLLALSLDKLINLLNDQSDYQESRIDLFRDLCKKDSDTALKTLNYLKDKSVENENRIWHAALVGLADSNDHRWNQVAPILNAARNNIYKSEAWAIATWIKNAIKDIKCNGETEKYFWGILSKMFETSEEKIDIDRRKDIVSCAINHPIGILAEVLIQRLAKRKPKAQEEITDKTCLFFLNRIVENKADAFVLGKVILASRLSYLYSIAPKWTKENLLPLFDWGKQPMAYRVWQGYLWLAKISIDLISELKKPLLEALLDKNTGFSDEYKKQCR